MSSYPELDAAEAELARIEAAVWVRYPEYAALDEQQRKRLLPDLLAEMEPIWRAVKTTIGEMRKYWF